MDQNIITLFDRFTHGGMSRRDFFERLVGLAGGTAAATALLQVLENDYAHAALVPEDDPAIKTEMTEIAPGIRGYLARPAADGIYPAVLVIHENRGLNPHIKDVTRRLAKDGFIAFGGDYLTAKGGTPADADKARDMIGELKTEEPVAFSQAAIAALAKLPGSNGKVGAVGFCWGGGQVNALAVADAALAAGVAYYGRQPASADVARIKAPLLLHYAGLDDRINAGIAEYEAALKKDGKAYELFIYDGVNHAFNNDTNAARYDKAAADLAWSRTVAFLKKNLG
ncbi:MAG: dienelactone hydrolase family protein [Hyphomicrobiales bacterium]